VKVRFREKEALGLETLANRSAGIHRLRTGIRMGISGKASIFYVFSLIQNAFTLSDKSVIHSLCNNFKHLLLVQPFGLRSLDSPPKL